MSEVVNPAVLIIEDSIYYGDLILRILKRNGLNVKFRVVTQKNAVQDALMEEKWDIILSDNIMPGFSALSALEVRNELCGKTPFVIVSEDISREELKTAFEKGCDSYISKDRISELPALVLQILSKKE